MEHGGVHMISAALSDEDIAFTLHAWEESLAEVLRTVRPSMRDRSAEVRAEDVYALAGRAFGATGETAAKWWPGFRPVARPAALRG